MAQTHDIALVDEVRAAAGQPTLPVVCGREAQRGQLLDRSTTIARRRCRCRSARILHETLLRLLRGDDGAHLAHAH